MSFRHSARALVLDEENRILLCRHTLPTPAGSGVWAAPGGGIEPGETPIAALRRELLEEIGLAVEGDPPHVWRQEVAAAGVRNDYFLVRTTSSFEPRGSLSDAELAAETISGVQWWDLPDIARYRGLDVFSPRDLVTPLRSLIAEGLPEQPVQLGL